MRRWRGALLAAAGAALLLTAGLAAQSGRDRFGFVNDSRYRELNERYREWLNMVTPIATSVERETFLQLPTVRDREFFIRLFWQQRDPTPGTEANEFRDQIEFRYRTVNDRYGRGTPRPGWMTDQGRIYMTLGPPDTVESIDQQASVYPAEVWSYRGDPALGLPPFFNLTFFRRHGSGEWVLYDPVADGPTALLVSDDGIDTGDNRTVYELLRQRAPTLVGPAYSIIPGPAPDNYAVSPRNSVILAHILDSPQHRVDSAYAASFLNYRGFVSADVSLGYMECSHLCGVFKDDLWGYNLAAFSIKPRRLALVRPGPAARATLALDLVVALRREGRDIYTYRRHYESQVEPEQIDIYRSGGVVIHDGFPVAPGDYRLSVFLQDAQSRDFCFFDEPLSVPEVAAPRLAAPQLGYRSEKLPAQHVCVYQAGAERLLVDPDLIFASGQVPLLRMGVYNLDPERSRAGRVEWELQGLNQGRPFSAKGSWPLAEEVNRRQFNRIVSLPGPPLSPGYYRLSLKLVDAGNPRPESRDLTFTVSSSPSVARPTEFYSQLPLASPVYFDAALGQQFAALGDAERAELSLAKALAQKPDLTGARIALLELWLQQDRFEPALAEAELLPAAGETEFPRHAIRGRAFFGLGRFAEALNELLAANQLVNTDTGIVNLIGRASLRTGDRDQAVRAFRASLEIDPQQPEIRRLLDGLASTARK